MSDEQRCATCRYWEGTNDYLGPPRRPGWGWWTQTNASAQAKAGASLAVCEAEDPYIDATLSTAPTFGCVQHEAA